MAVKLHEIKEGLEIATSKNIFAGLKKKSFTIIPDCLIAVINKQLSVSARATFAYLYGAYEKNCNSNNVISPVVISSIALADVINRSERTARRAIAELTKKGFVKIQHRFKKSGLHNSNAIYPIIPTSVAAELLKFPDRKAPTKESRHATDINTIKFGVNDKKTANSKTLVEAYNNDINIGRRLIQENKRLRPDLCSYHDVVNHKDNKSELLDDSSGQSLYHNYIKMVSELKGSGLSVFKAHQKTRLNFTKEELEEIEKFLASEKAQEIKSSTLGSSSYHDKNGRRKILNNNIVNNSNPNVDKSLVASKKYYPNAAVVNLNAKINTDYIEKSIEKLINTNAIPEIVLRNKSITDVVEEIKFHVVHRNVSKTKSALHALNAAKAMLVAGRWRTPKKFAWVKNQEAIARERVWQKAKEQESRQIKEFTGKKEYV